MKSVNKSWKHIFLKESRYGYSSKQPKKKRLNIAPGMSHQLGLMAEGVSQADSSNQNNQEEHEDKSNLDNNFAEEEDE